MPERETTGDELRERVLAQLLERCDITQIKDGRDQRIAQAILSDLPGGRGQPSFEETVARLRDPADQQRARELAGIKPDDGLSASDVCNGDVHYLRDGLVDGMAAKARRQAEWLHALAGLVEQELVQDRGGAGDVPCLYSEKVLRTACDPSSALHDVFTWDDQIAADAYRRREVEWFLKREGILSPDDDILSLTMTSRSEVASE